MCVGYPDASLSAPRPSPAGDTALASQHAGSDPDGRAGSAQKPPADYTAEPLESSCGRSTADHGRSENRSTHAAGKPRNRTADSRGASRSSDPQGSTTPVLSEILDTRLHRRIFRCRAQGLVWKLRAWALAVSPNSQNPSFSSASVGQPAAKPDPTRAAAVGPPPSPPDGGMMLSHGGHDMALSETKARTQPTTRVLAQPSTSCLPPSREDERAL